MSFLPGFFPLASLFSGLGFPVAVVFFDELEIAQGVEIHLDILLIDLALFQVTVNHPLLEIHPAQLRLKGDLMAHEIGGLAVRQVDAHGIVDKLVGVIKTQQSTTW